MDDTTRLAVRMGQPEISPFFTRSIAGQPLQERRVSYDEQIEHLSGLPINWDGRHSLGPTNAALDTARAMSCCPLGSGGVQIELHAGGFDIEIEVNHFGKIVAIASTIVPMT